ncbi:MAG: zinc ribbon domain-containing protein [Ruminococcaceae bacterium]|nr:zinc ribbon domain-containing protein [Oscillospiraceae bacterium]
MFCTKCGAKAIDGDMFCPECGARLKHASPAGAAGQTGRPTGPNGAPTGAAGGFNNNEGFRNDFVPPQPQTGWEPSGKVYQSYSNPADIPVIKVKKAKGKGRKGVAVISLLLLLVVAAMLVFAGMRGYLGETVSGWMTSCKETIGMGDGDDAVSDTDVGITTSSGTTTTATTTTATTTTTTTRPTTTTTTVDAKKLEAEEIRNLLVSCAWETELEGYDATVKFKKDGTATITVKVFLFSKTIDAKYSVNDKCHAVIQAEYDGQLLGISGMISKVSDTKLVVERDKNMGKVTLTAA